MDLYVYINVYFIFKQFHTQGRAVVLNISTAAMPWASHDNIVCYFILNVVYGICCVAELTI